MKIILLFSFLVVKSFEHDPACTQEDCEAEVTTELQIMLQNEGKAWARAGLDPSVINPDALGVASQVNALQQVLVKNGIVDQKEVDEEYRKIRYDIMHSIRMTMQPQVEELRRRAAVGLPGKPRIVGPHGELLG